MIGKCDKCGVGITYGAEDNLKLCDDCFDDTKELIKVDTHYVPWSYRFYRATGESINFDYYEDVYATLPSITWCEKRKKFKVSFEAADFGGYDVTGIVWYFDNLNDIVAKMMGTAFVIYVPKEK